MGRLADPAVPAGATAAPSGLRYRLRFPQLDRDIDSRGGETLFQSARRAGVRIVGACGGCGSCGTCLVRVVDGRSGGTWVRACQTRPADDCVIEVAPRSLAPVVRTDLDVDEPHHAIRDPAVSVVALALEPASLADHASDADRVVRALAGVSRIDIDALRELPRALRDNDWRIKVRVRDAEAIGFAAASRPTLGLAVDLGTTNVAGFLLDLESGERLAGVGIENPQVAWGADVVSRINHASRSAAGAEELRQSALSAINALAHDLCHERGAKPRDIADIVVCGNTGMHHLVAGLPVGQLGRAPFVSAVRDALDVAARDLGLVACAGARVHLVPGIAGFVGGDHVSALLATEDHWIGVRTSIVIDIGTNTEISVIHRGNVLAASCPSGPALEGGNISCGMRAAEGAIERVAVESGRLVVSTIAHREAVGVCGSGVVDALASMRRAQVIDPRGRIRLGHPQVVERNGERAVVLAPGVDFTQRDVRAVQLAKAAIGAGIELLLGEAGVAASDIDRFLVAGAFGAYIDVASGIEIGLFPPLPADRFVRVGNAAGAGARRMLASRAARDRARALAGDARYVELSASPQFQRVFIRHVGFAA